mgnify:CR=1 FL=1
MTTGIYVLNEGDDIPTGTISSAATNNTKGLRAPTNPTIIEFDTGGAQTNDLNCFEIWDARGSANANTINGVSSSALNREYPISTDTLSHQTTLSTTPGYKIHSDVTLSTIISGGVLKTDNDYFVLVYSDNGNKHHFAKITEVIKYDTMGDGFEFEPRLKEDIPTGTKFAIFRGPDTTDASYNDLVAVGYGLTSTGNKHNHVVNVSRPTFYFYNDHIDNPIPNELAHSTKYEVVKSRYVSSSSTENNNICFLTTPSFGPRLLDKSPYKHTVKIVDTNYTSDSQTLGSSENRTHYTNYAGSAVTYANDQTSWDACFLNSSRPVYTFAGDLSSPAVATTVYSGPSTLLTYVESPEITKVLENIESVNVSKTVTISGNYAEIRLYDFEKIIDEKIKMNDDIKVRSILYEQKFTSNYDTALPGKIHTNTVAGELEFRELNFEQDLSRLLSVGETLRIGDYIYVVGAIASKSSGIQIITTSAYKTVTAASFTTGTTIHDTLVGVKAYRRAWSSGKNNLMTNAKIDTEIDGSGNITKNGIAVTTAQTDYKNLNIVLDDGNIRNYRLSVNKGDKNNQYFELKNYSSNVYQYGSEYRGTATVTTNSVKYIPPILNYINGGAYIDNTLFDGTVEYIKSETTGSQMRYTISGRDDIGKLLSKVNNKKYLYSDEYVYSTQPPTANFTYTGFTMASCAINATSSSVTFVETDTDVYFIQKGDLIYYKDVATATGDNPSNFIFLGIANADVTGTGTLTFTHETPTALNVSGAKTSTDSNYNKFVTSDLASGNPKIYAIRNQLVLGKSIGADITQTNHATTLKGAMDKGINFISGRVIDPITGADTKGLSGSKSTGFTLEDNDNSLGYSISSLSEMETGKLSPETVTVFNATESNSESITTVSSMSEYAVIDMETLDDGLNRISVAPLMPVVLGRIDSNTSTTKGISNTHGIYLVNTNGLPNGGYLHLLNSETDAGMPVTFMGKLLDDAVSGSTLQNNIYSYYVNRFGPFIWRYIDLQTGNLYYEDEIANRLSGLAKSEILESKGQQIYKDDKGRIMAYVAGVRMNNLAHGWDSDTANSYLKEGSPETRSLLPVLGSNFYDTTILPVELSTERNRNSTSRVYERNYGVMLPDSITDLYQAFMPNVYDTVKNHYEANDPKCVNLYLFALGDVLPDSKSRVTHIGGVSNRNFSDYSIILKRDGDKISGDSHQKYAGILNSRELDDNSYSSEPINSASITPDQINRFGLIRLVELTMDWHYNSVDIENLKANNTYKTRVDALTDRVYKYPLIYNSNDLDENLLSPMSPTATVITNSTTGSTTSLVINTDNMIVPTSYRTQALTHVAGGTAGYLKFTLTREYDNLDCQIASGDATVTVNASEGTSNLKVGMAVSGAGIPGTTVIASITNHTTFEMDKNATGSSSSVDLDFDFYWGWSDFTNATSGTDRDVDFGLTIIDTLTGARMTPINVRNTGTHIELQMVGGPANHAGDEYDGRQVSSFGTQANRYIFSPITIWQNLYSTPIKIGEVGNVDDTGSNGLIRLGGTSTNAAVSGNIYFQMDSSDIEELLWITNTMTNFNRHLITGRLLQPYNFSDIDTGGSWNNEILPNCLALPLIHSNPTTGDAPGYIESSIGEGNSLWNSPDFTRIRSGSRVIDEMNDRNFELVTATAGARADTSSNYLGNTTYASTADLNLNAFNSASKYMENTIGIIVSSEEPYTLDKQHPILIDALNARQLNQGYAHITVDGAVTYDGSEVFTFDTVEMIDALSSGTCTYTGPTTSNPTGFEISLLSNTVGDGSTSPTNISEVTSWFNPLQKLITDPPNMSYSIANLTIDDNSALLVGKPSRKRLATEGMTFPIRGLGHPRGNTNNMWYMLDYGGAYKRHLNPTGSPSSFFTGGEGNTNLNLRMLSPASTGMFGEEDSGETNSFLYNNADNEYGDNRHLSQSSGAEIFYKPVLNLESADINLGEVFSSIDGKMRARIAVEIYNQYSDEYRSDMIIANNDSEKHNRWIHFAPNLTGCYLVSEDGNYRYQNSTYTTTVNFDHSANTITYVSGDLLSTLKIGQTITISNSAGGNNDRTTTVSSISGATVTIGSVTHTGTNDEITITPHVLNRQITNSTPTNIHKVISHRIDRGIQTDDEGVYGTSDNYEYIRHILEIDNVSGSEGATFSLGGRDNQKFRVMRVSQDTFYDFTPSEIPLLTFTKEHSKKTYANECYTTINKFNQYNNQYVSTGETIYNEGLLSMFIPINTDGLGTYVDIRDITDMFHTSTSGNKLVKGSTYNMHITDGKNKLDTAVTIKGRTSPNVYTLSLGSMKQMHGCVSFGELFNIDIFNKPKSRVKKCSIGTSLHVVDEAEKVINDLLENTDITYTTTSDTAKYYEAFNVQGLDSYSAANFVASLKGRKLIIDGKDIQLVKQVEDIDYTNISFNEFSRDNRIGEISRDNNLFDFYNQITVYGDGIKTTVRDSASIKKDGLKELEEVDLTIITEEACKRKALDLLKLHSESSPAISFKVLYDQCPYLKPGQIVEINYPSEKIPRGEYIVLEINYEISGYMDIKVGKYAKNLTNRIAELIVQGKRVDAALRGDRYKSGTPTDIMQQDINLRAVKLKVQYTTASSVVANVFGFTPIFGFDSTLGIMVPTGESTKKLEYDLL